ncbi:MAG: PTS lactose/cellobiose transporter subunit IIA [Erysipelotrichaceae bacterium]|jgi:PTS system cellobiose-specific IIA component|nr:PTS lactose/cellobiose transporter subunit IIA [Erysipelotrichaceae bacterium]
MTEELINSAMKIILHAGDARLQVKLALDAIALQEFDKAKECMTKATDEIRIAHREQTDAIQGEAQGIKTEYSLLFSHAQDTLMTIYSEINIAKQMIQIFEKYEDRIKALEVK